MDKDEYIKKLKRESEILWNEKHILATEITRLKTKLTKAEDQNNKAAELLKYHAKQQVLAEKVIEAAKEVRHLAALHSMSLDKNQQEITHHEIVKFNEALEEWEGK